MMVDLELFYDNELLVYQELGDIEDIFTPFCLRCIFIWTQNLTHTKYSSFAER